MLEWSLDTKTGDIEQTTRDPDTGSERVVEKTIDVSTLKNPDPVPQSVLDVTKSTKSTKDTSSKTTSDSGSSQDTSTASTSSS